VANESVRVEHVMKGYRADAFSKIETLVYMALRAREHAVFSRRLATQIDDPTLRGLIEMIATDEERHQRFFDDLVRACYRLDPEETVAKAAARAAGLQVIGADIDAYQDKVATMAQAGIFDDDVMRQVISDAIASWELSDRPELADFVRS
jgi:acyl-[acyl-carrier-protein] desaturase